MNATYECGFESFSTLSTPGEDRLGSWNHLIGGVFPGLKIFSAPDIKARWRACRLGDLSIAQAWSQKALIKAQPRSSSAQTARIKAHLQVRGSTLVAHGGNSARMEAGDLVVFDDRQPYSLSLSDNNQMLVISLPQEDDAGLRRLADGFRALRGECSGVIPVLAAFSASVVDTGSSNALRPEEGRALEAAAVRLIGGLLQDGAPGPARPARGSVRTRVLDFVERRLREPDLRTGMIAEALGLSARTIQDVFADLATTPTNYIRGRRLVMAARALSSGEDFGSITDLALDLGFEDSGYFARCFRLEFGVSPLRYRKMALK